MSAAFAAWLVATAVAGAQTPSVPSQDPSGEWLVAKKIARIKIANCDGRLWGVVAWEAREAGTDSKNRDPNLRSRPTLGMPILLGMTPSKTNHWQGEIYNSQDGNTYSASVTLMDPNTLRVQGCFLGFLCGGENWTRVEAAETLGAPRTQNAPPQSPGSRKDPSRNAGPVDDVCSRIPGTSRLPHERGLK